jgi:hypothetical protein
MITVESYPVAVALCVTAMLCGSRLAAKVNQRLHFPI